MTVNRRQFERFLRNSGCWLHHHGGKHDVWVNPLRATHVSVPRHLQLKRGTIRAICRALGIRSFLK